MKFISLLLFITTAYSLVGQKMIDVSKYAAVIDSQAIKEHVYMLASSKFEGRELGTKGNQIAALYIADEFSSFGVLPMADDGDYFQDVAFTKILWQNIQLTIDDSVLQDLRDYLSIPQFFPETHDPIKIGSLTFLGYGIDDKSYSDYKGKNLKGENLIVYGGEPRDRRGRSRITGSDTPSKWTTDPMLKVQAAKDAGASSIWIIEDNLRDHILNAKKNLLTGKVLMGSLKTLSAPYIPHVFISTQVGDQLLRSKIKKINKLQSRMNNKGESGSVSVPVHLELKATHFINSTTGVNVLGYIEGIDPKLKDQVVVVSAHYDHLGMRGNEIFFGADDNASGTSAVLEIAHAMAKAKDQGDGPRRSVLCILMTGEEKGLLGSQYYSEHPAFPLANTVADINIDMIGRIDTLHKQSNYTYVIGSDRLSTELHQINESMNKKYTHLDLDYTYNADNEPNRFYYRSDHYNFAKHGIPAIFFFSGVHEDYHRPTDTPDKIMYGKLTNIAHLAFYTAWELANRDGRIKVDVTGRN
jgi:hypothetical protein